MKKLTPILLLIVITIYLGHGDKYYHSPELGISVNTPRNWRIKREDRCHQQVLGLELLHKCVTISNDTSDVKVIEYTEKPDDLGIGILTGTEQLIATDFGQFAIFNPYYSPIIDRYVTGIVLVTDQQYSQVFEHNGKFYSVVIITDNQGFSPAEQDEINNVLRSITIDG